MIHVNNHIKLFDLNCTNYWLILGDFGPQLPLVLVKAQKRVSGMMERKRTATMMMP